MSSPEGYPESQSMLEQFPDSPPRPSWPPLKPPSAGSLSPELNDKYDPVAQLHRKVRHLKAELRETQEIVDEGHAALTRLENGINTLVDGAREGSHWSRDDILSFLLELKSGKAPRSPSPGF